MHRYGLGVLVILHLALYSQADLLPIVDPGAERDCSGHGKYSEEYGICMCDYSRSGRICQNPTDFSGCLWSYECYSCEDYACPKRDKYTYFPLYTGIKMVQSCNAASAHDAYDESVTITLHSSCHNITSFCYQVCGCPSGIAYMGSSCFRSELINNFGFFILIMAILTLVSTLFEFGVHRLERRLKTTNQKAVLGIIQTFKSELTLIGLIGLTLYLASSSEVFEHGIIALGGKEDIIEAIHFLIFFLILGYFFTLALCFVLTKIFLRRRLRDHEEIFQDARKAALRGENYDDVKQDAVREHNLNGCMKKSFYRQYNAFRIYFMNTLKTEYSEEDLMFFRYDEYVLLCVNDLIGKISGGTWLAWIFFAWNFWVDVYMQNWLTFVNRILLSFFFMVANLVNTGAKDQIFYKLKKQAEPPNPDQDQALIAEEQKPSEEPAETAVNVIVVANQILLWFGLTHMFTAGFAMKSISWVLIIVALVFMLAIYSVMIFLWLPTIAGAVYNGSNINKHHVKEVMSRYSQVDKHVLMEQYRNKNDGQLPVINDVFIDEHAAN